MERKLEEKMNIALTREERIILWDLIGRELDKLQWMSESEWIDNRIKQLKTLEILIVG